MLVTPLAEGWRELFTQLRWQVFGGLLAFTKTSTSEQPTISLRVAKGTESVRLSSPVRLPSLLMGLLSAILTKAWSIPSIGYATTLGPRLLRNSMFWPKTVPAGSQLVLCVLI